MQKKNHPKRRRLEKNDHISLAFAFCVMAIFICFALYLGVNQQPVKKEERVATLPLPKIFEVAKVRILIVPGHEPDFGGTEFKGLKERDMAVALGEKIKSLLEKNGGYEVFITRESSGWSPIFADYFKTNWDQINVWEKSSIKEDLALISTGVVPKPKQIVQHNPVSPNIATRLYGITKWANENNIDLMLHIHFNDDPLHGRNVAGRHSGFAAYVPINRYDNGPQSHQIAKAIVPHLLETNHVSSLAGEKTGVVDEPRLIAIGAHNTAKEPSVLIEYGYIYETKFTNPSLREKTLDLLASETFAGLEDYFKK